MAGEETDVRSIEELGRDLALLRESIGGVFLGREEVIDDLLICMLAGGHVLIEDVPGVGKTTLARALARSLDVSFARVQFTPDLLPSDILGVSVYVANRGEFDFKPGPIFASVVLGDEINRATPRSQSALLEAMNMGSVSLDGRTHELPRPFMVVATQNPHEFEGTFPLPESQYDRFLMRLRVGYPAPEDEKRVLRSRQQSDPVNDLGAVLHGADVLALQQAVRNVESEESILDYLVALVTATRESDRLDLGVSPRGSVALHRATQARAALSGRTYTIPDDVKACAIPVLSHRVLVKGLGQSDTQASEDAIAEILDRVEVPL